MRHHEQASRIGTYLGNAGYFIGLLEYSVTDIVLLRIFAIVGCGMVVAFQCLQPKVQWLSAGWCAIYVAVNIVQLWFLWGTPTPSLTWEQERLHSHFADVMNVVEFHALMELGEFVWMPDGSLLAEEGEAEPNIQGETQLFFVAEGRCHILVNNKIVADIGPGQVVGEIGLLTDNVSAGKSTIVASGSVRCFSVPVSQVSELMESRPDLKNPLEKLLAGSLAAKMKSMNERVQSGIYRAVLEVACSVPVSEAILAGVQEFRTKHGISDRLHAGILAEIPQCMDKLALRRLPNVTTADYEATNQHAETQS